ncbi:MAG TPA: AzlD domain-containing protein [Candidatus Limnocylindrales bacterium]|jgi:branched-subunit amino acid transport protein
MTLDLIPLAILMGLVTYPSRAIPLLVSQFGRLPRPALIYLRLVGPAVLAALAAVNTMVVDTDPGLPRAYAFQVGIQWLGVIACLAIVARWKNLLAGIVVGLAIVAGARLLGWA